ncbi:MAG: hypothetical protein P8Z35_05070 [Ignavibacteriaceae bacterium]
MRFFRDEKTNILLVIGIILIAAALIVKISDNPPGIALAYSGLIFLFLAFTHKFNSPKPYVILLISSVAALLIFGELAIYIDIHYKNIYLVGLLRAFSFLFCWFICPIGIIIGSVGSLLQLYKKIRKVKAAH